ncbi:heme peroxidase [Mycena maculata]|uniref:Peroxidase n=1 Tax=Mycena maculata TaxID=230809 RepID=A0AAD7JMU0_9AGAR|nr:heme peroxidase [Mycena maculata]
MFPLALFTCFLTAHAYIWPSPQLDALEAARFNQNGHNAGGIANFVEPCDVFFTGGINFTGRSNIADWLRTAYHDMATHNVTDGTGGMDASVRFAEEQERPENVGDGIANTIGLLFTITDRYISMADSLTLGPIIAIENCGGPEIAFRGGRLDAGEPNMPGVPEPQQDLETHIASFVRQGFTQTEMIGLVSCGHTIGGVQHDFFPDIVPELNDPNSTESVVHFDSTFVTFDNNLAIEYISGTTHDPLVVGFNDTTNSDKRIFGSDGNVTMGSFAKSRDFFQSTCAGLLARMFNTVPRGVQLTDVVTPLPVKPFNVQLILDRDTLKFSGEVRFWNMSEDASRTVFLLWDDHNGRTHQVSLLFSGVSTAVAGRYTAAWYSFNATADTPFQAIEATAGVTSMRFVVDGRLEDQGGLGFSVQDGVVFSNTSCATSQNPYAGHLEIAVRNGLQPARVYLEQEVLDSVQRITVVDTEITPPAHPPANASSPYAIWSIDLEDAVKSVWYTIGFELDDGAKFSSNDMHRLIDLPPCAS